MRKDLGFTQWQYTAAVNAFLLAYGVMYVGSGVILDRIGARRGVAGRAGRDGVHTEALGFLLAELQSVARALPGATW